MELCQIVIDLPSRDVGASAEVSPVYMSSSTVMLDIWAIKADRSEFIDVKALSWNSRPRRITSLPLATFSLQEGTKSSTEQFPCVSDSIQSFEMSCSHPFSPCSIAFWQGRDSNSAGEHYLTIDANAMIEGSFVHQVMYMIQYATV